MSQSATFLLEGGGGQLLGIHYDLTSLDKPGYLKLTDVNGLLSRALYPDAGAEIQRRFDAGDTAVVTDDAWLNELNDNGVCAKFSVGDYSTTFRVPYIPGLYPGAPVDGQNPGDYLFDAIRNLSGTIGTVVGATNWPTGVFVRESATNPRDYPAGTSECYSVQMNSALQVPIADVNRPKTAVMTPFIKIYGSVETASGSSGGVDLSEIIRDISVLQQEVAQLKTIASGDFKRAILAPVTVNNTTTDLNNTAGANGIFRANVPGILNMPNEELGTVVVLTDTEGNWTGNAVVTDSAHIFTRNTTIATILNPGTAWFEIRVTATGSTATSYDSILFIANSNNTLSTKTQRGGTFTCDGAASGGYSLTTTASFWIENPIFKQNGFTMTIQPENVAFTEKIEVQFAPDGTETVVSNRATNDGKAYILYQSGQLDNVGEDASGAGFNLSFSWTDRSGSETWSEWKSFTV